MLLKPLLTLSVDTISHADAVALVIQLAGQLEKLTLVVEAQAREIAQLKARLGKDSQTSSKPPSSDGLKRRTKSLRTKSGTSIGGQVGHRGTTLKKSERIDYVVEHPLPAECDVCGAILTGLTSTVEPETRQVIHLPAIRFEVTEHRILRTQCPCGAQHCSRFPADVISPVQYDPTVRATAVYLSKQQHIPYQRTAQTMRDLFDLTLSASTVVNYVREAGLALVPRVAEIADKIVCAPVVHFDETGMRYGQTLRWMHVASTSSATWYGAHSKRGSLAMDDLAMLPRFDGVAIHDGFKSYRLYPCKHGLCNAHHVRELKHLVEAESQVWAGKMISLLCEAKKEVEQAKSVNSPITVERVQDIHTQFHALLNCGSAENPEQFKQAIRRGRCKQSDGFNLVERLRLFADDVLRFISDFNVPFDNNQAERDIRMQKLQQKISGGFRSLEHMDYFCTIRSYLSTLHKNQQNLYDALKETFAGRAPSAV